jgi:hypothetical protein
MRDWGTIITIAYALIVLCLLVPGAAYLAGVGPVAAYTMMWIPIGIILVSQALLLFLSVDTSWRRLRPRAHILVSCLVTGVLLALLTGASILSVVFAIHGNVDSWDRLFENGGIVLGCWVGIWAAWTMLFYLYRRNSHALTTRATSWLLKGSVLELLIAVPSHVIVRRRDDCSAPVVTSFGIATGIAIMLLSFGPSVILLYRKRLDEYANRPSAAK